MTREHRAGKPDGSGASTGASQADKAPNDIIDEHLSFKPLKPFHFWLCVLAIMVVGLALRLPTITKSLWLDEAYTAWFTALSFQKIWSEVPIYEVHPPLYNLVLKAWTFLAGRTEAGLRSLSVAASLGTILMLAVSGKAVRGGALGDRVALLAAFLLAVNAGNISFAQQARPYAFETLTASAAVLSALVLLRRLPLHADGQNLRVLLPAMAGLAIGTGITLWLHNTAVFIAYGLWIGLTVALLGFVPGRRWVQAMVVGLPGVAALLIWSPFLLPFLHQSAHLAEMSFWVTLGFNDLLSAWYLTAGGSYPMVVILTFAVFGLVILWRKEKPSAAFLSVMLFLPLATVLAVSYVIKPFYIDRLFEWLSPIVLGLASTGIVTGLSDLLVRRVVIAAAVLFSLASTCIYYTLPTEDWRGIIGTVVAQARPGDIVVTTPNDISVPFAYYAPDVIRRPAILFTPTPYPSIELVNGVQTVVGTRLMEARDQTVVRDAIAGHSRVWLVERRADFYDPDDLVRKEITSGRKAQRAFSDTDIDVTLYE